jgi:hypothetical protein
MPRTFARAARLSSPLAREGIRVRGSISVVTGGPESDLHEIRDKAIWPEPRPIPAAAIAARCGSR